MEKQHWEESAKVSWRKSHNKGRIPRDRLGQGSLIPNAVQWGWSLHLEFATEYVIKKSKMILILKALSETSQTVQFLFIGWCPSVWQNLGSLYLFAKLCSSLLPWSKNCKDNSLGMSESSTVILEVVLLQGGDGTGWSQKDVYSLKYCCQYWSLDWWCFRISWFGGIWYVISYWTIKPCGRKMEALSTFMTLEAHNQLSVCQ